MGDLIYRQAAIEQLTAEANAEGTYGYVDEKTIVDCLNNMPTAKPEPKWISVSERLPEIGKQVLWCNKYGSIFVSNITAFYNDGRFRVGKHYNVIAWMELPEAYTENNNK